MKLFGKKKETKSCQVVVEIAHQKQCKNTENKKQEKGIKILGSGCAKCMELEKATKTAISELQLDYEIDHVTDFVEIASYGVMSTPALVLNGEVISWKSIESRRSESIIGQIIKRRKVGNSFMENLK